MLGRRLFFGILLVAVLLGLAWLDVRLSRYGLARDIVWLPRGIILLPVYLLCLVILTREVLRILNAAGLHPLPQTAYIGNVLIAASCWIANVIQQYNLEILHITESKGGWQWAATACFSALLAVACGVFIAFAAEMRRYSHPGGNTINLAGSVFTFAYLGLLSCFMIQLYMAYGVEAVLSLIIVTKMCDTGAYTVGKLLGRHRMTPILSPGKTIEGAIGGVFFACIGAWVWFEAVLPYYEQESFSPLLGWLSFGITIAITGMIGDLAGSLIKRDSNMKDSGHAVPGFGGLLDIFDSLLISAPAAYVFWVFGFVCPGKHL
ncbi:MAG: phosphatidate cytidylyltransferase [Planctomycetaceae bacterium]|jgi:phosphatidate cytidylyltransferase|nr:phosphatidate cytidylyltransferase [Planctomycetaceae bacterium]